MVRQTPPTAHQRPRDVVRMRGKLCMLPSTNPGREASSTEPRRCPTESWSLGHWSLDGEWLFNVDPNGGWSPCEFETSPFKQVPTTKTVNVPSLEPGTSKRRKRKLVLPAHVPAQSRLFYGSFASSASDHTLANTQIKPRSDMARHLSPERTVEIFYLDLSSAIESSQTTQHDSDETLGSSPRYDNKRSPPSAYVSEKRDDTSTVTLSMKNVRKFVHGQGCNRFGIFEIKGFLDVDTGAIDLEKKYVKRPKRPPLLPPSNNNSQGIRSTSPATPDESLIRPSGERRKKKLRGLGGQATVSGAYFYPGTSPSASSYAVRPNSSSPRAPASKKRAARNKIRRFVRSLPKSQFHPYDAFEFGPKFPKRSGSDGGAAAAVKKRRVSGTAVTQTEVVCTRRAFSNDLFDDVPGNSVLFESGIERYPEEEIRAIKADLESWKKVSVAQNDSMKKSSSRVSNSSLVNAGSLKFKLACKSGVDGVVYEGMLSSSSSSSSSNKFEGLGVVGYPTGNLYVGEMKNSKEHGKGTLMDSALNVVYRGDFENGRVSGRGEFFYDSGDVYFGDVRESMKHGVGRSTYLDGSTFEGEYVNDVRCGFGSFVHGANGSNYTGEWNANFRNGRGILVRSDGMKIDGQFRFNQPNGRGSVRFGDGSVFNGTFKGGLMDGRGTYRFTNGCVFEGRFSEDRIVAGPGSGSFKMPRINSTTDAATGAPVHPNDYSKCDELLVPLDAHTVTKLRFSHRKAGF